MVFSSSVCTTLLVLYGTEMAVILALNFLTILVFVKNRFLRKPGMYLVINLAVADMLVGAFPVSCTYIDLGKTCNIWKGHCSIGQGFEVLHMLWNMFLIASLTNLAMISIERAHATCRPFEHRVITQRVYGTVIAVSWLLASSIATSLQVISQTRRDLYFYVWNSFNAICLFVICVSYVSIAVKICCGVRPQHHDRAVSREKKLTKTLFIVTLVSLLLWLPFTICSFLFFSTHIITSLSPLAIKLLNYACMFLYYANSFANSILYATRMPNFRRAAILLCRRNRQRQVVPFFSPREL
ncbi:trace amine-associated receptor 7f-like [Montipora capricornis]|uniref:trace amine-associated receptor 7f-like n=1 Tax=Montipora capricornis TaxID=246305 RepID=UPI0035F18BB1